MKVLNRSLWLIGGFFGNNILIYLGGLVLIIILIGEYNENINKNNASGKYESII